MFLCVCNQVREHETDRHHLIGTQCGRCLDLIYVHRNDKGILRMSEFGYKQDGTEVKWKHSAHEDKWYVERKASNANELAEAAQRTRNDGGTKDIGDGRLVATIPEELFYQAHNGLTYGGRYKGILGMAGEDGEKMLSLFMQEPEIKIFMLNDNYRV